MRLSICIPTFNRVRTLRPLLQALHREINTYQLENSVEIVVSDNASKDGTEKLIQDFRDVGLAITYFRHEHNLGFGLNLNFVIAHAKGDYCWLMGSDDLPVVGSLALILAQAESGVDLIVGEVLTSGRNRTLFPGPHRQLDIKGNASVAQFISECCEISSLFAFMSSLIVRRIYWSNIRTNDYVDAHPYTHQIRLFTGIVNSGIVVLNLKATIVITGDEGNEWDAAIGKHFELDCHTLVYIANFVFDKDSEVYAAFGKVFRRQYGFSKMIRSRSSLSDASWSALVPTLTQWKYADIWMKKKWYDPLILRIYLLIKELKQKHKK